MSIDILYIVLGNEWMVENKLYKIHISLNQCGSNNPENLLFQSARCNQHIQTSMNYFETTEYNCKEEVKNRIDNLENINSIVKIGV